MIECLSAPHEEEGSWLTVLVNAGVFGTQQVHLEKVEFIRYHYRRSSPVVDDFQGFGLRRVHVPRGPGGATVVPVTLTCSGGATGDRPSRQHPDRPITAATCRSSTTSRRRMGRWPNAATEWATRIGTHCYYDAAGEMGLNDGADGDRRRGGGEPLGRRGKST